MTGTPSQIELAEQIKPRVNAEFDRVAEAFRTVACKQAAQDRKDTCAIIQILEEKRAEVMAIEHAGYFIRTWRELNDQVPADDRPGRPLSRHPSEPNGGGPRVDAGPRDIVYGQLHECTQYSGRIHSR